MPEGNLQFRGRAALLYLPRMSGVTLRSLPQRNAGQLRTGSLVFSTATAAAMEVRADDAFIRPFADGPTVAQITLVGPKGPKITARRGALEFSYRGELEKIAKGSSYRVLLDPTGVAAVPTAHPDKGRPREQIFQNHCDCCHRLGHRMGLREVFESPDRS